MQEGHERRLRGCVPGPSTLDLIGVGTLFRPYDVGIKAALEGRSSQSAQNLVAEVAARQIDMVRLQDQRAFELLPPVPNGANGPGDQP